MPFSMPRAVLAAVPVVLVAAPASAQEVAVDLDLDRLGRVEFPNSCAPAVQPRLQQALALLHSFWWDQAEGSFQRVVEEDPGCLVGYWGLAMALKLNPFAGTPPAENLRRGAEVLARAATVEGGTARERDYLEAVAAFYRDWENLDHRTRALTYEVKMRELAQRYPDDAEAVIFAALAAAANASTADTTFARQREIGGGLDSLFRLRPDHPGLAHYIIHVYDSPRLAHLGLDAARRYAEIAPAAFHALHMPSHIFVRLGMWEETIESNLASADASAALERHHDLEGVHAHKLHALDYVVYGYLQLGRDAEARRVVREVKDLNAVAPGEQPILSAYALAAIPARYALERRAWAEAAALPVRSFPEFRPAEAITHFARGLGAARTGDTAGARVAMEALSAIEGALPPGQAYWASLIEAQRLAVGAWVALAVGDTVSALQLAADAADAEDALDKHPVTPGHVTPTRELQADLLAEVARYTDARAVYEAVLARDPNRARSLFGAAWTAQLAGEHGAAAEWYGRFLALMEKGDRERPETEVARTYVAGYAQER